LKHIFKKYNSIDTLLKVGVKLIYSNKIGYRSTN